MPIVRMQDEQAHADLPVVPTHIDIQACVSFIVAHESRGVGFMECVTEHMLLSGMYWGLNAAV